VAWAIREGEAVVEWLVRRQEGSSPKRASNSVVGSSSDPAPTLAPRGECAPQEVDAKGSFSSMTWLPVLTLGT